MHALTTALGNIPAAALKHESVEKTVEKILAMTYAEIAASAVGHIVSFVPLPTRTRLHRKPEPTGIPMSWIHETTRGWNFSVFVRHLDLAGWTEGVA